jgi:hypothetical protein
MFEQTINWQEFVTRKHRNLREVLERAAATIESGVGSRYNLDLGMLPTISLWDRLPFSFTTQTCSGMPKEHESNKYSSVNGYAGNPNAILYAHSYMKHPLFNKFNGFLEQDIESRADMKKSKVHGLKEYEGLYLHLMEVWVPEEVQKSGDLEYLDRFWKGFNSRLGEFIQINKASAEWFWNE